MGATACGEFNKQQTFFREAHLSFSRLKSNSIRENNGGLLSSYANDFIHWYLLLQVKNTSHEDKCSKILNISCLPKKATTNNADADQTNASEEAV